MGVSLPRTTPSRAQKRRRHPEDYHDYVFRDGKLVGDFEGMYRYATGVPWEQDTRCRQWHAQAGLLMLKERAPYGAILEIGCGLGFIAEKLRVEVAGPRAVVEAFDISPAAIRRAQRLHPGVTFYADDITRAAFSPRRSYDLVVVRDLWWYVAAHLATVVRNINACVQAGGALYLAQSFDTRC